MVQQGLGVQGGQEALVSPEGPSLQGYPQLHPGQGSLGGPVDLQQNQGGFVGMQEAERPRVAARGQDKTAWGSRYERAEPGTYFPDSLLAGRT